MDRCLFIYVDKEKFAEWLGRRGKQRGIDDFIVEGLPARIQKLLGTDAGTLRIGPEFFEAASHKERRITPDAYALLLNKAGECTEIYRTRDFHIGLIVHDGRPWIIILKTTQNGKEAYLATLHRIEDRILNKWRKRGERIF